MMVVCCSTRVRTDHNSQTRSTVTIDRSFLSKQREISVSKPTSKSFFISKRRLVLNETIRVVCSDTARGERDSTLFRLLKLVVCVVLPRRFKLIVYVKRGEVCFGSYKAPRHEDVWGSGGIVPIILDLGRGEWSD
jgi:hypothetical protein